MKLIKIIKQYLSLEPTLRDRDSFGIVREYYRNGKVSMRFCEDMCTKCNCRTYKR